MKMKIAVASVCGCLLCLFSGAAGAYWALMLESRQPKKALQVRQLELIDADKRVRGRLAVEDDGEVTFRMLSTNRVPVIELSTKESSTGKLGNMSSPNLTLRDDSRNPVIELGTSHGSDGVLFFSNRKTRGQVSVGYQPYGDVVDGVDRGIWGIQVKGPNHESTGVGVYTEDGKALRFLEPRKTTADH